MTLANPRKIIEAYTSAPKQTSYFGLPARTEANFETDPSKIADTTTLGGALAGLAIAGGNGIRNLTGRTYNAIAATGTPTTTFEQRTADFAGANTRRYQPQGVRPAATTAAPAAPAAQPKLGLGSLSRMSDGTFPGQAAFAASEGATTAAPRPAPAARPVAGIRRPTAAAPKLPEWTTVPAEPVEITPAAVPAPEPLTRELPVQGAEFDAQTAEIPGANGGFGLTRNADGTVDRMISLRSRTAAEDAANPLQAASYPAATGIRLRPGDTGYTGSQQAWEDQQATAQMMSNPFPFKTAAALLAQRTQGETEANNLRTFGLSAAKTAADVQHLGTEDLKIATLLPGEVATQAAGIRQSDASAVNSLASAGKTAKETETVVPLANSEIGLRSRLGANYEANTAETLGMLPLKQDALKASTDLSRKQGEAQLTKAEATAAKNDEVARTNASHAFNTYLSQNPGDLVGAQAAYDAQIQAHDQAKVGNVAVVTPAVPAKKGTFGIGRKPGVPASISYVPKAAAPPAGFTPTGKTIGGRPAYTGPDGKIHTF